MKAMLFAITALLLLSIFSNPRLLASEVQADKAINYQVHAIGWVRKLDGRTLLEINPEYQGALLGVDQLESIWVLDQVAMEIRV